MDKRLAVVWVRILAVFLMLAIIFNTVLVKSSQAFDPLGVIKDTLTAGAYTRANAASDAVAAAQSAMMMACSPADAAAAKALAAVSGLISLTGITVLGTGNPGLSGYGSGLANDASTYGDTASQNKCTAATALFMAATNKSNTEWDAYFQSQEESIAANFVDVLSIAFNQMKTVAIQQFAQKTGQFLAAGATGQKAMFNTQGLKQVLAETGDAAVGGFVDSLSKSIDTDLCNPNFGTKAGILIGLRSPQLQQTNCSAQKLMSNWQSAAQNPNFSTDFRSSLNPDSNSITWFLSQQGAAQTAASNAQNVATVDWNGGWNGVMGLNGQVKTPSSLIKLMSEETYKQSVEARTTKNFMGGTAADIQDAVGIFLSTFLNQTINYYAKGIFSNSLVNGGGNSSNGGSTGNGSNNNNNPIINPDAGPQNNNQVAAQESSLTYFSYDGKTGNRDDILLKLTQCPNPDKPGPTDCVLDSDFADAIRGLDTGKIFVNDLPDSIKNRQFAPQVNPTANFENVISLRTVMILREYRIVPVGWEIAAEYIAANPSINKTYTLKDLIDLNFNTSQLPHPESDLKGLIDPYWVLKAPELYCRRTGYGPDTSGGTTVNRSENYCADPQQCLQEDAQGKCLSYGYCTEEQRLWKLNGEGCDQKYNTCTSFETKDGNVASYLANTLDYRNCNAKNSGCTWYSYAYWDISNYWQHISDSLMLWSCVTPGGCTQTFTGVKVKQWHNVDDYHLVIMDKACTTPGGCTFGSEQKPLSCTIPYGGIRCQVNSCNYTNLLAPSNFNANFASCSGNLPAGWSEEGNVVSSNSGFSCSSQGQTNNALDLFTVKNTGGALSASSPSFLLTGTQKYRLTFYAKNKSFDYGQVTVGLYDGSGILINASSTSNVANQSWQKYSVDFTSPTTTMAKIKITSDADTVAEVLFDDFSLEAIDDSCSDNSAWFTLGATTTETVFTPKSKIYFDGQAQDCDSDNAGCSQFIRTKAQQGNTRLGSNLLSNSSFEDWSTSSPVGWSGTLWKGTTTMDGLNSAVIGMTSNTIPDYYGKTGDAAHEHPYLASGFISVRPNINYIASGFAASTYFPIVNGLVEIKYYNSQRQLTTSTSAAYTVDKTFNRIMKKFKTDGDTAYVTVNFVPAYTSPIFLDEVKLEEVNYNVDIPTDYSPYDPSGRPANQIVYLKYAPNYLNCYFKRYQDSSSWPKSNNELLKVMASSSPKCANYAQVCSTQEVGCEAYTPVNSDPMVPGVAKQNDLCPQECLGYSTYKQEQTNFVSSRSDIRFIADKNLKKCTQEAAGCDEFTNLDKTGSGAEVKEYYTGLKVCQKENPITYYTWEGDDISGYQLKVYNLKISQATSIDPNAPCVNLRYNTDGTNKCEDIKNGDHITSTPSIWPSENAVNILLGDSPSHHVFFSDYVSYLSASSTITSSTILNQSLADDFHKYGLCLKQEIKGYSTTTNSSFISIGQNPDCREFYDASGKVSYRLLSRTVTVSADCHPYRRTQTQSSDDVAKSDCENSSGYWNITNKDCIYMSIPGEGKTCSSNNAGCREYTGNTGNNIYNAVDDSFNSGTGMAGWTGGELVSMSNYVGGVSLENYNGGSLARSVAIQKGRGYILSFWAKGGVGAPFILPSVTLGAENDLQYFTTSTRITGEWQYYQLGPVFLNNVSSSNVPGELKFNLGGKTIYLDNVILKETKDSVFAIENSWFTPISCDNELLDPTGSSCTDTNHRCTIGAMLGCRAYTDSSDQKFNLRSFTNLCRPEAVGCEALIDTHNSNSPVAQTFNLGNPAQVIVPADNMVYLVNDKKFQCPINQKGCTIYGLPQINAFDEVYNYSEVAKINDPERYNLDLCRHEELWCNAFSANGATAYFKDPGVKTCQYKSTGDTSGWFLNGTTINCSSTDYQTIGNGVPALKLQPLGVFNNFLGQTDQNYKGWAGSCSDDQNSCTEYIDPLAKIYTPIILNGGFEGSASLKSYWGSVTCDSNMASGSCFKQNFSLDADYLYTLNVSSTAPVTSADFSIFCAPTVGIWSPDNSFSSYNPSYVTEGGYQWAIFKGGNISVRFYPHSIDPTVKKFSCGVEINANSISNAAGNSVAKISLVKSGVYYYKSNSVDRTSCNGQVDEKNGCVLLNERNEIRYDSIDPATRNYSYLNFSAWLTSLRSQPTSPVIGTTVSKDSNSILKVSPDRKCSAWLYCTTYQKTDVASGKTAFDIGDKCLDLGLCRSMDENGDCLDFDSNVNSATIASDMTYKDSDVNKTGYSKLGKTIFNSNGTPFIVKGFYPFQYMPQLGNSAYVPNGGFESTIDHQTEGLEPLGWSAVTPVSSSLAVLKSDFAGGSYNPGFLARAIIVGSEDYAWKPEYFSVISDPANAFREGNYLQLNGEHYIASEAVSLTDNATYTLSYEINTKGLLPKSSTSTFDLCLVPFGKEITEFGTSTGNCIPGTLSTTSADEASGGWEKKEITINGNNNSFSSSSPTWVSSTVDGFYSCTPNGTNNGCESPISTTTISRDRRFRIVMHNYYTDVVTSTDENVKYVGGYSMVDDIDIKPTLSLNDSDAIKRDCRLYPTNDSLSCDYIKNGTFYSSWYGYCLMSDPSNSKNCLQWWPVDRLKDDNIDEVRSYNGSRAPLYYCINSTDNLAEWHPQFGSGGPWSSQGPDPKSPGYWFVSIGGVQKWGVAYSQVVKCMNDPECSGQYKKNRNLKQGKNNAVTISFNDKFFISTNRGVGAENFAFDNNYSDGKDIFRYYGHNKTDDQWYPLEGLQSADGNTRQFRAYPTPLYIKQHPDYVTSTPFFMDAIQVICAQADNGSACTFYNLRYKNYLSVPKETAACVDLVQVVDAFGQSSPYYRRIADGSAFKVRGADYGSDYSPFGSAVIEGKPENLDSNPLMDGNQVVRADAPNLTLMAPYQTRAGTLSIYYDIPSYLTAINIIYDVNGKLGFCSRRTNVVCNDAILPCNSDETCNLVADKNDLINKIRYFRGTEDLRRLFLKDYGWWQYVTYHDQNGCSLQDVTSSDDLFDVDGNKIGDGGIVHQMEYVCGDDTMVLSTPTGNSAPDTSGVGDPNVEYADNLSGSDIPMPGKITDSTNARYQRFYNSILPLWNKTNKVDPGISNVTFGTSSFSFLYASTTRTVIGRGVINLNFSVMINAEQLPLKAYTVNWGDGSKTEVTDANLFDKSGNSAINLYHFYDYFKVAKWSLDPKNPASGTVCLAGQCWVRINITVTDSWGAKRTDYPVWIHVNENSTITPTWAHGIGQIIDDPIPADTIDPLDVTPENPTISGEGLKEPIGASYTIIPSNNPAPAGRNAYTFSTSSLPKPMVVTAKLTFSVRSKDNQWPIRFYNVDWGDNTNSEWNGVINTNTNTSTDNATISVAASGVGYHTATITVWKQYSYLDLQFMYRKNPPTNGAIRCYKTYTDTGYNPKTLVYDNCEVAIKAFAVDNLNAMASTSLMLTVPRNGDAQCQDGSVQSGEECDDGNDINNDSCKNNCTRSNCGNGIKNGTAEKCDCGFPDHGVSGSQDGKSTCGPAGSYNSNFGNYCTETCKLPVCGDGFTQAGLGEQCDDGNKKNGDGCDKNCQLETCGDGVLNVYDDPSLNEQCDDGNRVNGDGCDKNCKIEPDCGDGIITPPEKCDQGNDNGKSGSGCNAKCKCTKGSALPECSGS